MYRVVQGVVHRSVFTAAETNDQHTPHDGAGGGREAKWHVPGGGGGQGRSLYATPPPQGFER